MTHSLHSPSAARHDTTVRRYHPPKKKPDLGFTLIELMIVVAVIAILLALALPTYNNYSTRAKISEGIAISAAAKTATSSTCQEDPNLEGLDNAAVGYSWDSNTPYVSNILVEGNCSTPTITIYTQDTGAPDPQPIVVLTGDFTLNQGRVNWTCASSNTPNHLLPDTCRS